MRAAFYQRQGPAREVLTVAEIETPTPARGEVLVRVHMSGINPSDIKNRTGFLAPMAYDRIIPHQDGAGVIEAVGADVSQARIGERVWLYEAQWGRANGTAAEYVALPSERAIALPDNISFETGAALGVPALTAHRSLFADGALPGRHVLVQGGAGAVGSAAIRLAKWAGAWVAATVRRPEQAAIASKAGADLVLAMGETDVAAAIKDATRGAGVDRIVEVALAENLELDIACLAVGGSISSYAAGVAGARVEIPNLPMMMSNAGVRFVYVYKMPAEAKQAAIADIGACLAAGAYDPAAAGLVLPLDRIAEAHEAVETGAAPGKVLIRLASGER